MDKNIDKARLIAMHGVKNSESRDEAIGTLLFLLSVHGEDDIVEAYLKKFDTLEGDS